MKSGGSADISNVALISSIGNRILIGFVIGISAWRTHYLLHGALMGLIVTLSISIGILLNNVAGFLMFAVAGVIYGFLIELFVTKVFKAPMT